MLKSTRWEMGAKAIRASPGGRRQDRKLDGPTRTGKNLASGARAWRARVFLLCLGPAILSSAAARAEVDLPTTSLYGGVGLLDTRTARFMPDGDFSFTAAAHDPDDRLAATFQMFPWAEATFRYSINYAAKSPFSGQRALYDRSFDLKIRLIHESDYFPEIAVGFQDMIGTGVYAGEYFVASKRFGPVDASIGIGWGRFASCPRTGGGPCSASIGFANPFGFIWPASRRDRAMPARRAACRWRRRGFTAARRRFWRPRIHDAHSASQGAARIFQRPLRTGTPQRP